MMLTKYYKELAARWERRRRVCVSALELPDRYQIMPRVVAQIRWLSNLAAQITRNFEELGV